MIDWDRIRDLRAEIGPEDFAEVAALFLDEADTAIQRLSSDATAQAMEADLHFLKGAALNLGFRALAALCQDGERRAAGGDTSVDLDAVRSVYVRSRAAFDEGMAAVFAA